MIIKDFFYNLKLKTKLLIMMLFLTLLLMAVLFYLYTKSEKDMIAQIEQHTVDLSTAIQISVEELTTGGTTDTARLSEYLRQLDAKGVREISIISNEQEIIASSNPRKVGIKVDHKKKGYVITARLGEDLRPKRHQKAYNIIVPVVIENEQWGYIHISMLLDDFKNLMQANYIKRVLATVLIFGIGIVVSLFLSWRYTHPIHQVVNAAKKVAAGDLTETLPVNRTDEIGELTMSFNEMVEKLRLNRKLEEKLRRAEQLSVVGQLASGIAHEVRNPLNLINLSIDHIKSKFTPPDLTQKEEFTNVISNIKKEIRRLDKMVSDFLDYGKPLNLHKAKTSLKDVLDDVISLARERSGEQGVVIEKEIHPELLEVLVDSGYIKTCFMNIMLNAFESMPEGGNLRVTASPNTSFVEVSFADTGKGIPSENLSMVYEPYFTTKRLGIGLGLSLTKRIIEEHSGMIEIESYPNKGTTVKVKLPTKES
ncbi:MAG: ATP-binding protein [Nitrospirota bacterium]